jgi:hypothetical protein
MKVGKFPITDREILDKFDLPYDAQILDIRREKGGFMIIIEHDALEDVRSIKEAQIIPHWDLDID